MSNKMYIVGIILIIAFFGYKIIGQPSSPSPTSAQEQNMATIVDGKQVVKMTASYGGYIPNYFKIKAGIPVIWQISVGEGAGCAGAVVSPKLFPEIISLAPNTVTTKEFVSPATPGVYRFSCSMGMYTGSFEVIN